MSFFASNNEIYITNSGGQRIFDTNRKMPAITSVLTGSLYMSGSSGVSDGERYFDVGAAPYNPEFVFPTFRVTFHAGAMVAIPGGIPFSAVGSTVVNASWSSEVEFPLVAARVITVVLGNGRVYFHEDRANWDIGYNPPITVDYKIYLGSFV